ncbi:MAG TPA: hypothetical protein VN281_11500 [Verrucomicrobiae bacterium]|jgi:hypothetical protein|nr:hypothetical protein [Verrucomicrobiae bacterium]
MKKLLLSCVISVASALCGSAANAPIYGVRVDTNGNLTAPANFFSQNVGLLDAAIQVPTNTLSLRDQLLSATSVGTNLPQTNFTNSSLTVSNLLFQLTQPFDTNQNFNENWFNLLSWAGTANVAAPSNNALYAMSGSANPAGVNWGFNLGTTGQGRVRATLIVPTETGTVGYALVGLNTGTTNSAPASGLGGMWGVGIADNTFGATGYGFMWVTNGVFTASNTNIPAGTYDVVVSLDQTNVSLALIWPNGTNVEYISVPRGPAVFGNVEAWLSDSRTYGGLGIGPLGAHKSYGTILGNTNESRLSYAKTVDNGNGAVMAAFWPPNYNAAIGAPVLLCAHGSGKTSDDILPNATNNANYFLGWITNGFIVAMSDTRGSSWGSQNGVNDMHNLLAWIKAHGAVREVVALGESMGFVVCLNWMNQQVDSPPVCAIGLFPVCDQVPETNGFWNVLTNFPAFPALTNTSWATVTAGFDPCTIVLGLNDPSRYQGTPIHTHISFGDGIVNWISNSVVLSNLVGNAVGEFTINTNAIGNHGDLSHFNFPDDWAFYLRSKARYNYGGTLSTTTHQ